MAGILSYGRKEAAALPLSEATVEAVIAKARRVCLTQLAAFAALVGGLVWGAVQADGLVVWLSAGLATLAAWGLWGALFATLNHFIASIPLRRNAAAEIARETDPKKFWWTHREVFPLAWD
ncbi:hypothetical protein [Sinisalibacter lacisalsi]|uniref:Uncharacterized protein n=1 Tax=Sinisalibacter lacisalsi TaxID=1526570 RepID=A0ABQ1QN74_9RHOB|nr:hypothetical protein [Sinisalibacter lacisalsi]GGD37771.1 hypothetical protein GCM10011358_21900 [Sinisalibacter lacisalsi]